jgi:hypothetical protein
MGHPGSSGLVIPAVNLVCQEVFVVTKGFPEFERRISDPSCLVWKIPK